MGLRKKKNRAGSPGFPSWPLGCVYSHGGRVESTDGLGSAGSPARQKLPPARVSSRPVVYMQTAYQSEIDEILY
jgi:hypothetical protein